MITNNFLRATLAISAYLIILIMWLSLVGNVVTSIKASKRSLKNGLAIFFNVVLLVLPILPIICLDISMGKRVVVTCFIISWLFGLRLMVMAAWGKSMGGKD